MKRPCFNFILILILIFLTGACGLVNHQPDPPLPVKAAAGNEANFRSLNILYTNDEHGWLLPVKQKDGTIQGGVAELYSRWRHLEGYSPADSTFLILSGGDNWTGPAISSFFQGTPTFEVMQQMGYAASTVGNHEFDFGLDTLQARIERANFPYLAANIVYKGTDSLLVGCKPYVILERNGIRIGIIGLASVETPHTTSPTVVSKLEFLPYDLAIRRWIPMVEAQNVDVTIALTHACEDELTALAPTATVLGIDLLLGGHCHRRFQGEVDQLPIIIAECYWKCYGSLEMIVDRGANRVIFSKMKIVANSNTDELQIKPDARLAALIAPWEAKADEHLNKVIGYADTEIPHSPPLFNLITDGWLAQNPGAQIALSNRYGARQSIDAGPITYGDIFSVLPFNNFLIDVNLSGAAILEGMKNPRLIYGGLRRQDNQFILPDGTPLDPNGTYKCLMTDFMYSGGDNFTYHIANPNGNPTGIDWRQPIIEYIKSLQTTVDKPLNGFLDTTDRPTQGQTSNDQK